MYTKEIIQIISWPLMIYVIYRLTLITYNKLQREDKLSETK